MTEDSLRERLSQLIEVNREAEAGLLTAAKNVQNSELETLFSNYAAQHSRFAGEMQAELERVGGHYAAPDGVGDALHRGWISVKAALTGHSAGSMLAACENGELSAESAYLDATETHPPGKTQALIDKHIEQIRGFRTRLARLSAEVKDGLEFPVNEQK